MRFLLPLSLTVASAVQAAAPLPTLVQTVNHPNARWAVHVDGQRAVASDSDEGAVVLVPRNGSPRSLKVPGKLRVPIVTPEGRTLAVQLDFGRCQVVVWDVTAGRKVTALQSDFTRVLACGQETEFIFDISFTPNGRFLLTADQTGLRRWDAQTGRLRRTVPGKFFSQHVSPDGRSTVTVGEGRRVEVWTADLSRRLKALPPQPADCYRGPGVWPGGLSWSPDSTRLAFSCGREVRVWNIAAGGVQSLKREDKREYPDAPAFSPDGRYVVADEDQFGVAAWNAGSGQRVAQLRLDSPQVQATTVRVTSGNLLLAALDDGRILRLNLSRPAQALEPLRPFPDKSRLWPSLAVSREGDRLAVASGDGRLNVYKVPGN